MSMNELDLDKLLKQMLIHVDQVTCLECCKYYIAPTTAGCGHSMCHGCWSGRRTCASCGDKVDRKTLKLNLHLQNQTDHAHAFAEEFEQYFHVKLGDYSTIFPGEIKLKEDHKNVKDWLQSSENRFSAPQSTQDSNNQPCLIAVTDKQIHNNAKIPKNTALVENSQDAWDKIEEFPDTEEDKQKNKENVILPMEIESCVLDLVESTSDNQRHISPAKDRKGTHNILSTSKLHVVKNNKKSASETDTNVKGMLGCPTVRKLRKFSKLHEETKNKLNVSIEKYKKTKKKVPLTYKGSPDFLFPNIDESTPTIDRPQQADSLITITSGIEQSFNNLKQKENSNIEQPKCQLLTNTENTVLQVPGYKGTTMNNSISENKSHNNQVTLVPFIKKGALRAPSIESKVIKDNICSDKIEYMEVPADNVRTNSDAIEITIKVGNTLTNICIKKNENDVQLKINTDKEAQTSLDVPFINNDSSCLLNKEINSQSNVVINLHNNQKTASPCVEICQETSLQAKKCVLDKNAQIKETSPAKKNTESADTATVQFEITESIEKELSKEMNKVQDKASFLKCNEILHESNFSSRNEIIDNDDINDVDLFENDSVKEGYVQSLKSTDRAPSEILVSTLKSNRSKNKRDTRSRDDDLPASKRLKPDQGYKKVTQHTNKSKHSEQDSEITNYDVILDQVFANIDADLAKKSDKTNDSKLNKVQLPLQSDGTPNLCDASHNLSENILSTLEKQNEVEINNKSFTRKPSGKTQPTMQNQDAPIANPDDGLIQELTPAQNKDDSDGSVFEETPLKSESFRRLKQKDSTNSKENTTVKRRSLKLKTTNISVNDDSIQNKSTHNEKRAINLSDTAGETLKNAQQTVAKEALPTQTLETPITISKFINQITHESTPKIRKALNFGKGKADSQPGPHEIPSTFLEGITTQEREFMSKAFEDSPSSRAKSPLTMGNPKRRIKYCLAGSRLTAPELKNMKQLCSLRGWQYVEKYTNDITHLVVGVDEEKKSERSVKYMCALAAGKWIVSYEWVEKCLQLKNVAEEEIFEALDSTGEPGPRRSRISKQKLFKGITFYCMPPFSVLDVETLKMMLESAGGKVVHEPEAVRVTDSAPAFLLAEPEHTQEDRFIYLAIELRIVPVNFEWILNCLGSYTLSSVQELLLCPTSMLPAETEKWPPALMAKDYDSMTEQ